MKEKYQAINYCPEGTSGWTIEIVRLETDRHYFFDAWIDNGELVSEWSSHIYPVVTSTDQIKEDDILMQNEYIEAKNIAENYLLRHRIVGYNADTNTWYAK